MSDNERTPTSDTMQHTAPVEQGAVSDVQPHRPVQRSRTRRTCMFCLGSTLLVIFGLALLFGAMFFLSAPSRKDAVRLIESEIVPALKTLDGAKLQSVGTANLQDSLQTTTGLRMLNGINERIGPLRSVDKSQVQWNIHYGSRGMLYRWRGPAVFEKDSTGTLSLILQREDGKWKLDSFSVNSPDLI